MNVPRIQLALLLAAFAALTNCVLPSQAAAADRTLTGTLHSSDIQIVARAGAQAPSLVSLSGAPGNVWRNDEQEAPPPNVTIGNATVPLAWTLEEICLASILKQ